MKKIAFTFLTVAALSSLSQLAVAGCDVSVSRKWAVERKASYTISASSLGPNCVQAAVVLIVRDGKGEVKYSFAGAAKDIGTFGNLAEAPVTDVKKMRVALAQWLDAGLSSNMNKLSNFPDWKTGADGPASDPPSEFPFTVSSDVDRNSYIDWRKQNLPVFCFVQGMESARCIVLTKQDVASEVGIQSFPG